MSETRIESGVKALMVLVSDALGCSYKEPEQVLQWAEHLKAVRLEHDDRSKALESVINDWRLQHYGEEELCSKGLAMAAKDLVEKSSRAEHFEQKVTGLKLRAARALGYPTAFRYTDNIIEGIQTLVDERNRLIVQLRAAHDDIDRLKAGTP